MARTSISSRKWATTKTQHDLNGSVVVELKPDLQPNLKGELIELRPLRPDEFEALYAVASDPLIWEQHPQSSRYQREVFQKYFDDAVASKGALVVLDNQSGRIIGCSRYYDYKPEHREIVIGYTFLTREFWGGGTNAELKSLMLNHIFQYVDSVQFHVGEKNFRSRKAMEKIGGIFLEKRQEEQDYVAYKITKNVSGDRKLS
jgi:RimJ/RimL family protein N-acetyltransferase